MIVDDIGPWPPVPPLRLRPVEHLLAIALAAPPEPPTSHQTTMRHRDPLDVIAERYGVSRDRLVPLYPERWAVLGFRA